MITQMILFSRMLCGTVTLTIALRPQGGSREQDKDDTTNREQGGGEYTW